MSARHTVQFLRNFASALYALAGLGGIYLLWVYAPWMLVPSILFLGLICRKCWVMLDRERIASETPWLLGE